MVFGINEGRVELVLDGSACRPGEAIKGKVSLFLPKPQKARQLRVEFFGEMETGTGKNRRTERVFEVSKQISGEKSYANGETYGFDLIVPINALAPKPGIMVSLFNFFTPAPRFYVQACLDMPMKLDMNKKVPIQLVPPKMPMAQI